MQLARYYNATSLLIICHMSTEMDNIACAVDRNVCSNWTFLFAPHGHELRNLNNPTPPDFVAATESSILFV